MRRITVADTLNLSVPERIILAEEIWNSVAAEPDMVEITEQEKKIIDRRLESYYRNPDAVSSWDEVRKRIMKR